MRRRVSRIVLGETAHLLELFKRSSLWSPDDRAEEDPIVTNFRILQQSVRKASIGDEQLTPLELVFPFCEALRASYLSAPYKNASLVALQNFFQAGILTPDCLEAAERTEDAVTDIVDALVNCRLVQTDKVQDQLIHFRLIQVIQAMCSSGSAFCLTDETLWNVVEHCYLTALQPNENEAIRVLAESTLFECIRFVYSNLLRTEQAVAPRFGAPGAVKVFGFFCSKMQKFAKRSITSSVQTRAQLAKLSRAKSSGSFDASAASVDSGELRELVLSMKAVQAAMEAGGKAMSSFKPLFDLIRDDVAETITLLTSLGYPMQVLRLSLDMFRLCFELYTPSLLQLVQAYFMYVYLRALHQLSDHLQRLDELEHDGEFISRADGSANSHLAFTVEERELVVGALIDLLSVPEVVPTLFVNFDCHPHRPSLIEPILAAVTSSPTALVDHFCLCIMQLIMQPLLRRAAAGPAKLQLHAETADADAVQAFARTLEAKRAWRQGARLFLEKPRQGLAFLQEAGCLRNPLDAEEVASFLRYCPFLTKEAVGAYLGALGVDSSKYPTAYAGDTEEFHKEVLRAYCRLFAFKNQPILSCLRVFLSAFLLPREAQQIDRILLAFAEFAHRTCLEGVTNLFESEDVTYLFTVSIIMLNTDLHNANIRPDRRMKPEQFVKNNQNYGVDYHQTRPLPVEFLESVYKSIQECPIRTEGLDRAVGVFTEEEWADMQLQVKQGMLSDAVVELRFASHDGAAVTPEQLALDQLLLESLWRPYGTVAAAGLAIEKKSQRPARSISTGSGTTESELEYLQYYDHAVEILLWVLKVAAARRLHHVVDSVVLLLCQVALGAGLSSAVDASADASTDVFVQEGTKASAFARDLVRFVGSRIALLTVAQIAHMHGGEIRRGWLGICALIAKMRDAHLLPRRMLSESEVDVLPVAIQEEFEELLVDEYHTVELTPTVVDSPISSTFSLRGFTDLMFGAPSSPSRQTPTVHVTIDREALGRWDAGALPVECTSDGAAEGMLTGVSAAAADELSQSNGQPPRQESTDSSSGAAPRLYEPKLDFNADQSTDVAQLTAGHLHFTSIVLEQEGDPRLAIVADLVGKCRFDELLAETKFLASEPALWFLLAMMYFSHANDAAHLDDPSSDIARSSRVAVQRMLQGALATAVAGAGSGSSAPDNHARDVQVQLESPSVASSALFEVLITETLLRNRDRLHLFWPLVEAHYAVSFTRVERASYLLERRVVGVLRLLTRLGSKGDMVEKVLSLVVPLRRGHQDAVALRPLQLVAPHIATGLWRFVTLNVTTLPQMPVSQWDLLFGIVATAGKEGGFASVKAFELMVVLLHDPQLRVCIPNSCVQVVEALVSSPQIPKDVVLGSLRLLQYLTGRMALVAEAGAHSWRSYWYPILQAIAKGVVDLRVEVRRAGLKILMTCVIDEQAARAPADVVLSALVDVVASTCKLLVEGVCQRWKEAGAGDANGHYFSSNDDDGDKLSATVSPALEALSALSKAVLAHLTRISSLPAFHALWSQILYIFGMFLGGPTSCQPAEAMPSEWLQARETALELFKNMLLVMVTSGTFEKEAPEGDSCWSATWSAVSSFEACPNLLSELFPSCSPTKPPTAEDVLHLESAPQQQQQAEEEEQAGEEEEQPCAEPASEPASEPVSVKGSPESIQALER